MLVSGSDDLTVALWDITDRAAAKNLAVIAQHTDVVTSVRLSPDGRTLVTTSWDRTARLWDVTAPRAPRPLSTISAHKSLVWSAVVSSDGTKLTTASEDGTVGVWDARALDQPKQLAMVDGASGAVSAAVLSPDGRTIASVGNQSVYLRSLADFTLDTHQSRLITAVTADGRMLVTDGEDLSAWLWDISDPLHPRELGKVPAKGLQLTAGTVSRDGRTLAIAGQTHGVGHLLTWDISDPRAPRLLAETNTVPVYSMRFSPDGHVLATGHDAEKARLWDVSGPGRLDLMSTLDTPKDTVWAVKFTPDGRTLMASTDDLGPGIRIWSVADPRQPKEMTTIVNQGNKNNGFYRMTLSGDGRTLAAPSTDRAVHLWDITDPAHPCERPSFSGGTEGAGTVTFSPDDTKLAVSFQNDVQLWDVSGPGDPVRIAGVSKQPEYVTNVAFSPDGHTVAVSTEKPSVFLWETYLDRVSQRICALAEPKITTPEWARYFPDVPYSPPCP